MMKAAQEAAETIQRQMGDTQAALDKIAAVKTLFGIDKHYLEGLLGL